MSDTRVKIHPKLGILVCTDGHVMVPANGNTKAHWTYGCKGGQGYMYAKIAGKRHLVHRLVAETFIGEIPEGCQIDHINRVRSANQVSNLRIVSPSDNNRNTKANDRVDAQGRTHFYEDFRKAKSEQRAQYYAENKDNVLERNARYKEDKCKTHRRVRFADGSRHYIPHEEALELLKLPRSQRFIKETIT